MWRAVRIRLTARAEALIANDDGPERNYLLARTVVDHARMEIANAHVVVAADLVRRIAPVIATAPPGLAAEHTLLRSEIAQWNGEFARAQALATEGRVLLHGMAPGPVPFLLTARAYDLGAEAAYYDGKQSAAIADYRTALAILEDAARRWPDNRAIAWSLVKARWALGTTLLDAHETGPALPLLAAAYRASSAEADSDPADHIASRRQRSMAMSYGQGLIADGRADAGVALIRRSVVERHREWMRYPRDPARSRDWLVGIAALGDALLTSHRKAEACTLYARATSIVRQMNARNQLTELDRASVITALAAQRTKGCAN